VGGGGRESGKERTGHEIDAEGRMKSVRRVCPGKVLLSWEHVPPGRETI